MQSMKGIMKSCQRHGLAPDVLLRSLVPFLPVRLDLLALGNVRQDVGPKYKAFMNASAQANEFVPRPDDDVRQPLAEGTQ